MHCFILAVGCGGASFWSRKSVTMRSSSSPFLGTTCTAAAYWDTHSSIHPLASNFGIILSRYSFFLALESPLASSNDGVPVFEVDPMLVSLNASRGGLTG